MKKKVYILLVQIATIAILLSLITVGLIFYKAFEKQVFLDLETMAHLYASVEQRELNRLDEDVFLANHVRISIIDKQGNVLYDNNAPIGNMENHADREEIQEALKRANEQSASGGASGNSRGKKGKK